MTKNNTKHAIVLGIGAAAKKLTHKNGSTITSSERWRKWRKCGMFIALFMAIQIQNAYSFTISGNHSLQDVKTLAIYGNNAPIVLMEIPVNQTCSLYSTTYPSKGTLNFKRDFGYIKINKGAKLYITDGILTSENDNMDNMWYGIYVDGTSTAVQNTSLVNTNTQGYLFMERDELKHVKRGSSSSVNSNTFTKGAITVNSGGIIRIYQSTLDNNEVGIHFEPYANSNISDIHYITFQNPSSFVDARFTPAYKYTDRYVEIDQCVDIYMSNDHFLYNTNGVADFEILKLYIEQKNYADATEWLLTVKQVMNTELC